MNIEFSCDGFGTGKDAHGQILVTAQNFHLTQTTDPAPLLSQMDERDLIAYLESNGHMVDRPVDLAAERGNERITLSEFAGDFN
ncbi:hypothetical protein [Flyfo siphovirus Tbat2_3]|nr:hypothetical protein [Flyfo siphovirus Tbat2_3]